jgi:hypothetical protein
MSLPTAAEVVAGFLFGTSSVPASLNTQSFTEESGRAPIPIDTTAYMDPLTGPGRFALAANSPLVQAFFADGEMAYAAANGSLNPYFDAATGSFSK